MASFKTLAIFSIVLVLKPLILDFDQGLFLAKVNCAFLTGFGALGCNCGVQWTADQN
jgi:hypothetical protein